MVGSNPAIVTKREHIMAQILVYNPTRQDGKTVGKKVFLSGTIDDGNSVDWQSQLIRKLGTTELIKEPLTVFNPRRPNWGKLEQDVLEEQINWELDHQEACDINLMVLMGDSKSPISLLELGLFAKSGKLVVLCPETFYRFENVRVTCLKYDVTLYYKNKDFSVDEIVEILADEIDERNGRA